MGPVAPSGLSDSLHLVSSWLNVGLYTIEVLLCQKYLRDASRPFNYKVAVGAMAFFDTIGTAAACAGTYIRFIHFATKAPEETHIIFKQRAVVIFMTYATALIEQCFLCNLYFHLTRNYFVTGILALCVLAHTGLSWTSASLLLGTPAPASITTTLAGVIICAVTDVLIALCLCLKLWQFLGHTNRTSTRSFLQRIMILIISSGAIVGSNTLIVMILLLNSSPVFRIFFICQGRVYALSLLGNFLVGTLFSKTLGSAVDTTVTPGGISRVTSVAFRSQGAEHSLSHPSSPQRAPDPTPANSDYEDRIHMKRILSSSSPSSGT
ncbi:hypothetical protein B0H15DRAFT_865858 [Mycena belliarum]|uniref:DUF6534 domain-containing protein n=1 Tax=Mycena belliarum TaxID=1033014 RepID=A0AAD6XFI5_9AGAR|nr:hypothetical protein B0H15DRAFT_865858 [Mycena belliae]